MGAPASAAAVVVATTDPGATADFLALCGFGSRSDGCLVVEGGAPGAVELVAAAASAGHRRDFERGPRAIDLYTTDLEAVLDDASATGWTVSGPGTISVGPLTMRQALVVGPDGLPVVLVESTHRRSSVLDTDPGRRCSEPHSVVWCVPDLGDEAARWVAAGFTMGPDLAFEEPAVSDYLGLPRSPGPIRMTMLSGPDVEPVRLELLEFPDDAGPDAPDTDVSGIRGLVFRVDDPDRTASVLELDRAGRTPGGIRVELRDRATTPAP